MMDWAEQQAREVAHSMPLSDIGSTLAIKAVADLLRHAHATGHREGQERMRVALEAMRESLDECYPKARDHLRALYGDEKPFGEYRRYNAAMEAYRAALTPEEPDTERKG